jgi:hypothetical protein
MTQATLVVSRTLPADVGQRQVYVELDGERIATLLNGESITRSIAAARIGSDSTTRSTRKRLSSLHRPTSVSSTVLQIPPAGSHCPFLAVMGVAPLYLKIEKA